jgi:hypothetical protein
MVGIRLVCNARSGGHDVLSFRHEALSDITQDFVAIIKVSAGPCIDGALVSIVFPICATDFPDQDRPRWIPILIG